MQPTGKMHLSAVTSGEELFWKLRVIMVLRSDDFRRGKNRKRSKLKIKCSKKYVNVNKTAVTLHNLDEIGLIKKLTIFF